MVKKQGSTVVLASGIAGIGNAGMMGMIAYAIQKILIDLPNVFNTILFWVGLIFTSAVFSYAVFRLAHGKAINFGLFAGSAGIGIVLTLIMSPLLPMVFPYNPIELSQPGALEAGGEITLPLIPTLTTIILAIGLAIALIYKESGKKR